MGDFLPYKAEYAKSDRSSCKGCQSKIAKDTLRIAAVVRSPAFDGVVPKWYHYICFFAKQKPKAVGDIENFEGLKWDDQEKIREKVASISGASNGKKTATKRGAGGSKKGGKGGKNDFQCDLAKSNRSTCRGCQETIIKGELRVAKVDYESDEGRRYGGVPLWHHADCFIRLRNDLEFWAAGDTLAGFTGLDNESKEKLKTSLPEIKPVVKDEVDGGPAPKKIKGEELEDKEKAALKKQVDTLQKYMAFLKTLSRPEIASIMEHNEEPVLSQSYNIERITDAMAFGWPEACEKCKSGYLVFKSLEGAYKCKGNLTEWVRCDNVVREPKRKAFNMPPTLMDKVPSKLWKKTKLGTKRIIKVEERSVVLNPGPSTSAEPKIKSERILPLKNMEFVIFGKLATPKEDLKKEIMKMGGKVVTKIHKKLAAVISTQEDVDKMSKRMVDVEEANIQVVPELFLQESLAGNAIENITRLNMATWGSDAKTRLAGLESLKSGSLAKSSFARSQSKVTMKVKNGAAVDPESNMENKAHVYIDGKDIYSAVLSLTDVVKGSNKYYRIQILEADQGNKYWTFRAWGRIGTTIGGTKLDSFSTLQEAKQMFESKYESQTGNVWKNRHNFRKMPNLMVPMDIDMGVDETDNVELNTDSSLESKLPKPVQDLIGMLFNVETMKKVMLEFELDLEKMPLGKISKKQIQSAMQVLSHLQDSLEKEANNLIIIDASNRFYTLIPHDCGLRQPPLLDNLEIIKTKMEMLENMVEIEVAFSLLKSSAREKEENPLDVNYNKLNTEIEPLPRDTDEFAILEKYVKNTHAATHSSYSLIIEEIFKIKRQGEEKRFKPFKKLHNRKLLWHGSRITNFAGILSQGLRIAPPEAPTTGYMFGKGVYFADMVSKSANYCMTSPSNNTGLLMLCEVALGDMYERNHAEYIEKLPPGKHSCMGIGATWPNPDEKHVLEDGVVIPFGAATNKVDKKNTSLLYNEYIVYDVAQIKAKYLFRMKFDYKF